MEVEHNRVTRYHLLEPIRQYAKAKLNQSGEMEVMRDRHLSYFVVLSERFNLKPFGQWSVVWKMLKWDIENLRAALDWALGNADNPNLENGLRLAISNVWDQGGLSKEGHNWLTKALTLAAGSGPQFNFLRAKALQSDGLVVRSLGEIQQGQRLLEEGVAMLRECDRPWDLALALSDLAQWAKELDPEEARLAGEESVALARQLGDPILLGITLFSNGISKFIDDPNLPLNQRYLYRDVSDFQESLEVFLQAGTKEAACLPLISLSDIALRKFDLPAAVAFIQEYLRYRTELDDRGIDFYGNNILAEISYWTGDFKSMDDYAQDLLDLALGQNNIDTINALHLLGISWKRQGDYRQSSACFLEGLRLCQETKDYFGICANIAGLAGIAAQLKHPAQAAQLFSIVEKMPKPNPNQLAQIDQAEFSRDVATVREALTIEEFSQAWAEGEAFTAEMAIREAYAIAEEFSR